MGIPGREELGLPQLPAVLQARRELQVRRRRLPGRQWPAVHQQRQQHAEPALRRLGGGRRRGRLHQDRRLQRLHAGRLRRHAHDGEGWRALVHRQRLPAPGHGAAQPDRGHPCHDPAHPPRRQARRGRGVRRGRPDPYRALQPRGAGVLRADRLAAPAAALRHRTGGGVEEGRDRGPPRPAGRGREPAGPLGNLHPVRVQGTGDAEQQDGPVRQGPDWPALAAVQGWPGRQQPLRGGWLHPLRAGPALAGHPVPLPAGGDALRR
ncbi:hypothetical protein D3C78_1161280 [compost metagenome]